MKSKEQIIEIVGCADINLDNLAKAIPGLSNHPYFKVVKMQLAEALSEECLQCGKIDCRDADCGD